MSRLAAIPLLVVLFAAVSAAPTTPGVVTPAARLQTEANGRVGDSLDDPAIWVHPTEPTRSLILATDKKGGLNVYRMDGRLVETLADGSRPNNVDVLYGFRLGGKLVDLAVAACRGEKSQGVKVWTIDAETGRLSDVTAGGLIAVFGGQEPYGCCTYHSRRDGRCSFFVNHKSGRYEQYVVSDDGGKVAAKLAREFRVDSQAEGCVADEELGVLYVSEEDVGLWRFSAEPDGGDKRTSVAKVGEHGLAADLEGVTIYCAGDGTGYVLLSSQGNNTFKVFRREGANEFVLTIDPKAAGGIDDVSDTDGIAVTNRPTSKEFPKGMFVVQDGHADAGGQNFKLYAWEDIADDRLKIDTAWDPRGKKEDEPQ